MTINVIASYVLYKNKMAIGRGGDLLVHLKKDMEYFKNITMNMVSKNDVFDSNVLIMGKKTWISIPKKHRPLKGRISFILTNEKACLMKKIPLSFKSDKEYFISMSQFNEIYKKFSPNVFVIGGSSVYNHFIPIADNIYLTEVSGYKANEMGVPDTFINPLKGNLKLVSYSEQYKQNDITFRFLKYKKTDKDSDENVYTGLLRDVLENGKERPDRTGVGTISLFGKSMKFDISNGTVPLLTTKYVPFKSIVEELLWMMQGSTDAKILDNKGVKIWNGNTSRDFLNSVGLGHFKEGILGAGYSWQIRHFGAIYSQKYANMYECNREEIGGFDQLKYIEELLKNDPYSRRIMMCYWNPVDFQKMALLPCHYQVQFYVEDINNDKYLSCIFNMRSNDMFLGNPFNIVFYTLLTHILAKRHNMKAKELIYFGGDVHIYKNHITQVRKQLQNEARPFPKVHINDNIISKDWLEMTSSDFELVGYTSAPYIRAPMAV